MATLKYSLFGVRFTLDDGAGRLLKGGSWIDWIFAEGGNDTVEGGGGNDFLFGGHGDDLIRGDDGNDVLRGDAGKDIIYGGRGDDVIHGGEGGGDGKPANALDKNYNPLLEDTEQLYGGDGNDWIDGGAGEESIFGDAGNDTLYGGSGHDYLVGGDGNDFIYGGDGLDQSYGGAGNDTIVDLVSAPNRPNGDGLYGDAGDDVLTAGDASNVLVGGTGKDVLTGGKGDDVLVGGADIRGANNQIVGGVADLAIDRFVFRASEGNDTISGFELGRDLIDLRLLPNVDDKSDTGIFAASNDPSDTVLALTPGHSIRLMDIDAAAFAAAAEQHILF